MTISDQHDRAQTAARLYGLLLLAALAALPVLGFMMPRFMAVGPALLGLLAWAFYRPVFKVWPTLSRPIFVVATIIVGLAFLSHFWAVDPDFSLKRTGKLSIVLLGGMFLISVCLSLKAQSLKHAHRLLPWSVFIAGGLCVFDLITGGLLYSMMHAGAEGIWRIAFLNRPTVIFSLCLFAGVHIVRHNHWFLRQKVLFYSACAALVALIGALTDSQSVQLALLVGSIFYFIFPYTKQWAWSGLLALILVGFWSAPWVVQWLFQILPSVLGDVYLFQQSYAADRLEIWDFVSRRMLERPILGYGIESMRAISDFDSAQLYHADTHALHPHNFIIQIWFEFGAVGIACLSGFFMYLMNVIRHLPVSSGRVCLASSMACLSVSSTAYGFWQGWWLGTLILVSVLCVLCHKLINENIENK